MISFMAQFKELRQSNWKEAQLHLQTFEPLVIAGIQDKLDKNVVYMN